MRSDYGFDDAPDRGPWLLVGTLAGAAIFGLGLWLGVALAGRVG